ncbi:glycosyltransferase 87 family protein [Micromonospora sp. WMMD812]|uniref:glycosyltransferase 87 family protein n=1 Tax=Micromonospora sp. WMMD812 TaxID=3015152 RepID=UPI00248B987C|nr:glycosyltransferase 87 family protein [Micromonospora sp. WMMD812]WBB65813.1 glycosyltransferase 87 family protein [Micromonospora sp. WMMD812]
MTAAAPTARRRGWRTLDTAAGGLALDLGLYAVSAGFAALTAATSTLLPHRAWGATAAVGYLIATLAVAGQLLLRRRRPDSPLTGLPARLAVTGFTWATTALLPLIQQSIQRAAGRTDRAQEEVLVVEQAGTRLVDHGTPYLGHDAIAALPADERLLGYTPYQPGMALFGLPRAVAAGWWTDARVWFAVGTALALVLAVTALRRHPIGTGTDAATERRDPALLRAVQAATVLPICALTLATGGDDLPVLALCLLALALAATGRAGWAGVAVGLAGALKLFAGPVALVLIIWGVTRRAGARVAAGAVGLPVVALLPALLVDRDALVENVLRFPLGHGLVTSPAQSPFPGHLIATGLPGGRVIAAALLLAAGAAIAVRLARRPPRTAAASALICGYGLLAAIALMPSTRFGYLLYPLALLVWAPALHTPALSAAVPTARAHSANWRATERGRA